MEEGEADLEPGCDWDTPPGPRDLSTNQRSVLICVNQSETSIDICQPIRDQYWYMSTNQRWECTWVCQICLVFLWVDLLLVQADLKASCYELKHCYNKSSSWRIIISCLSTPLTHGSHPPSLTVLLSHRGSPGSGGIDGRVWSAGCGVSRRSIVNWGWNINNITQDSN